MVVLELDYLHDIERLKVSGTAIIQDLAAKIGLGMDDSSCRIDSISPVR